MRSTVVYYTLGLATASVLSSPITRSEPDVKYQSCPLLNAYYPPPTLSTDIRESLKTKFSESFDDLVRTGISKKYGAISPNTTSFSVVFFSGAVDDEKGPVVFEYGHTAPTARVQCNDTVNAQTKFAAGDLTQVLTVYAWLVEHGEMEWNTPITHFLPELKSDRDAAGDLHVEWDEITIGNLAGQASGLPRSSHVCSVGGDCSWQEFKDTLERTEPYFLSGTSPVTSYAAFQLLAFALQESKSKPKSSEGFNETLSELVLQPLGMSNSGLLKRRAQGIFAGVSLNTSQMVEPAAVSLFTSTMDLARLGNAILSSKQLRPATKRGWLADSSDTSNLRNGIGRPWEMYRAADKPISPITDVNTKSGSIGAYASYFGVVPSLNVGFAILAHDTSIDDGSLDLNVYADIASEAIVPLSVAAATEMAAKFTGRFSESDYSLTLTVDSAGPGLVVESFRHGKVDLKASFAREQGIKPEDLDFRVYPTNMMNKTHHQWLAVYQDKSDEADQGTPTCISWMSVGAHAPAVVERMTFQLGDEGNVEGVSIDATGTVLSKQEGGS